MFDKKAYSKKYSFNYYQKNKEKLNLRQKKYYQTNKQKVLLYQQSSIARNYRHLYNQQNKEKINQYNLQRYHNNLNHRLAKLLRDRLRHALKASKNKKLKSALILVGCGISQLIKYIESKFHSGMSWDNYGEWEIDHIQPCALFDFSNLEEQKKCFHYTNLQPLWKIDNRKKNARFVNENC